MSRVRSFLKTPRGLWISAIVLAVAAVLFVVGSSSPKFCGACHAMRPYVESHANSTHTGASCYDCHLAEGNWSLVEHKAAEFFRMYPTALLGRARDGLPGPASEVARARCLECHGEGQDVAALVGGLRILHSTCSPSPASCDECHSAVPHGAEVRWIREPVMEDCVGCHAELGAPLDCDTCHAAKIETERLATGPWSVTHGPQWRTTHGLGDVRTCVACHTPSKCAGCHGVELPHPRDFPNEHGTLAISGLQDCLVCHDKPSFCDDCHGIEMPHPKTFRPEHSSITTDTSDPSCLGCHRESDCGECHIRHTHPGRTDGTLGAGLPTAGGQR